MTRQIERYIVNFAIIPSLYSRIQISIHFTVLCRYTINGEAGWGVSEWQYRNRTLKEELKLNLPRVHADATLESQ